MLQISVFNIFKEGGGYKLVFNKLKIRYIETTGEFLQ